MRIRIIGGSDAGISAAFAARESSPDAEISVFLADDCPNFSFCGLPFFLSGETPDWRTLANRIEIRKSQPVTEIDIRGKTISVQRAGKMGSIAFDKLIVATGDVPLRPDIQGLPLIGVVELRTMEDAFRAKQHLAHSAARSAIIVGAGYIEVEKADALSHVGMRSTLVDRARVVFPTVDPVQMSAQA